MAEKERSSMAEFALKAVGWAVVIGIAFLGLKYVAAKI